MTLISFFRKLCIMRHEHDLSFTELLDHVFVSGIWRSIDGQRPLFSFSRQDLKISERLVLCLTRKKLSFCERRMEPSPRAIGISKRHAISSTNLSELSCMMVIGSLGAGGAERQLVTLLEELHGQKIFKRLSVACIDLSTPAANFYRAALSQMNIEIIDMKLCASGSLPQHLQPITENLPKWAKVRMGPYLKVFDEKRPDIVHLWMDEVNVIGGLAALSCGIPGILLSARSQAPYHFRFHQPWMKGGYKTVLRHSHVKLYANSVSGMKDYAAWLDLPETRLDYVYNGFALPEVLAQKTTASEHEALLEQLRKDREGKSLSLLAVGRLSEEKQPFYLIAMFREILRREPHAHLLWIGDGVLEAQVEAELRSIPPGHVTRASSSRHVLDLIKQSDGVILSSRIEGLPNVLIESQALGRPVFTPSAGGASESFRVGKTGVMLPQRAPEEAARLLIEHLRNGDIITQARESAPAFISERFDKVKMAKKTIALYQALLEDNREFDRGSDLHPVN